MYTIKAIGIVTCIIAIGVIFVLCGYFVNFFIASFFFEANKALILGPLMFCFEMLIAVVIMTRSELKSKSVDFAD